ncbi:MAG TPA: hypothetical protein VK736_09585, partial [Candidatus Binatia bacterium]|nr:hypothetical protein [Candidatus Binatia bacterium]
TCAAYILQRKTEGDQWAAEIVALDAVDLLVEASNIIAAAEPQPEPMALLEPVVAAPPPPLVEPGPSIATWTGPHDTLPQPRSPKACPQCDSRTAKKVFRQGRRLMLACPVCAKEWPYG